MRNPIYETALTNEGAPWRYLEKVVPDEINFTKSLSMQARLEDPLPADLVESYAAGYKRGDPFPPLVLWRPVGSKAKWLILDGNCRAAAGQTAKVKGWDAYAVECEEKVAERIAWTLNLRVNGRRLSYAECLEHAASYALRYGVTDTTAADLWGVKRWEVTQKASISRLREKIANQTEAGASKIDDARLWELKGLGKLGDDVLAKGAAAAVANGLTPTDCKEMCGEVFRAPTHAAKMEAVAKFTEKPEIKTRKAETRNGTVASPRPAPRDRMVRLLKELNRLSEDYPATALRPPAGKPFTEFQTLADGLCEWLAGVALLKPARKVGGQ